MLDMENLETVGLRRSPRIAANDTTKMKGMSLMTAISVGRTRDQAYSKGGKRTRGFVHRGDVRKTKDAWPHVRVGTKRNDLSLARRIAQQ